MLCQNHSRSISSLASALNRTRESILRRAQDDTEPWSRKKLSDLFWSRISHETFYCRVLSKAGGLDHKLRQDEALMAAFIEKEAHRTHTVGSFSLLNPCWTFVSCLYWLLLASCDGLQIQYSGAKTRRPNESTRRGHLPLAYTLGFASKPIRFSCSKSWFLRVHRRIGTSQHLLLRSCCLTNKCIFHIENPSWLMSKCKKIVGHDT